MDAQLSQLISCRIILIMYGLVQIVQLILFLRLSPAVEANQGKDSQDSAIKRIELSGPGSSTKTTVPTATASSTGLSGFLGLHEAAFIVLNLSILFFLDSFTGSLVFQSLIAVWFDITYNTSPELVGNITQNAGEDQRIGCNTNHRKVWSSGDDGRDSPPI